MKDCYVVGAGQMGCRPEVSAGDLLIAADGGYDSLAKLGLVPTVLMGDFDSIISVPSGVETISFPAKKDYTDMYLCYLEGKKRGAERFFLYGGTGGRADHTFANYSLLLYAKNHGDEAYLIDEESFSFVLKNEGVVLPPKVGDTVSVFAFGGNATVSIKGLEYECEKLTISQEMPIGVSNSSKNTEGEIKVFDGALLVMVRGNFEKFKNSLDK